MTERSKTDLIVIHCSFTKPSMDHVNEDVIRQWHLDKGWSDAGYNIVIPRKPSKAGSGYIEIARPLDHRGAHVAGYNDRSLGICLVGGMSEDGGNEDNFLPIQLQALERAVWFALGVWPQARVTGHTNLNPTKTCPNFDWRDWAVTQGFPVT